MIKRERDVKEVIDDLQDVLVGVDYDTGIEACIRVLVELIGTDLTYEDLRHIIEDGGRGQEYA